MFRIAVAALLLTGFCGQILAQSSVRPSLAGEYYASQKKAVFDSSNYNILLGPISVDLSARVDFDYNDNITYSQHDRLSDLLIEPQINANILWQVSEVNSLRLNLGIGYQAYLDHSQYDSSSLTIAPNSQLEYDVYIGDFKFALYDRFSIQQNPATEINVANVARFGRIENSAGISGLWDANQLTILGGYTHYNFIALENEFDYATRAEEQFYLSAGLKINDTLTVGVRSTFGLVHYDQDFNSDSKSYSAGVYAESQMTRYLFLSVEGGYQGGSFDGSGLNGDKSQLNGFYARLQLRHRLNAYWTETLDVGHETQIGLVTNFTETTYVRYNANWRINSRLSLTFTGFYEHAKDSAAPTLSERINWYGASGIFAYDLSRKIHLTAGYRFTNRDSDLPDRNYDSNEVLFGVGYTF
jgi:hypothetical protein